MSSWSVRKIFSKVSAAEFRDAVDTMRTSMEKSCATPMAVSIDLYNDIPSAITSCDLDLLEWLREEDLKMIFANATSPGDITDDLWDKAAYVQAKINPVDGDKAPAYAFGNIEAKGLKPRQMTCYAQPDYVGEHVKETSRNLYKGWIRGDGMDSNRHVSYG